MFDKTKESSKENEDLKEEEDTSTDDGQSEENNTEDEEDTSTNEAEEVDTSEEDEEETVESLKEKLQKAESDRDNYKKGMISAKAKKRTLQTSDKPDEKKVEINEKVVLGVLERQAEKSALRNTIDPKHKDYIPELVDDSKYNQILAYLPRSMDKGDYYSIVKSLKLATRIWKEENGIKDKKPNKKVDLPSSKTTQSLESKKTKKKTGRTFIKKTETMGDWYN